MASELVSDADNKLFHSMVYNNKNVLHFLLPDRRNSTHSFRKRPHDRILPNKTGHLSECTFPIQMINPLKRSGVRWLQFKVFNVIEV